MENSGAGEIKLNNKLEEVKNFLETNDLEGAENFLAEYIKENILYLDGECPGEQYDPDYPASPIYHTEDEIRLSRIWKNMIARCEDCGATAYARYGARGITVCEEWHSFEAFKAWAFTSGYESTLTIDRKDNNGGYCPENCRWATDQEQNCNKRNNRNIEYNGEVHNIAEWAKILDKRMSTLHWRLVKAGWSVERAFTTPCAPFSKNHNQEI